MCSFSIFIFVSQKSVFVVTYESHVKMGAWEWEGAEQLPTAACRNRSNYEQFLPTSVLLYWDRGLSSPLFSVHISTFSAEPEFVNVEGAQESIPPAYVTLFVVPARQATKAGGIDSLESIPE